MMGSTKNTGKQTKKKKLSPDELAEYTDLFNYYDTDAKGQLPMKLVPELVRSCGMSPTASELSDMILNWRKLAQLSARDMFNLQHFLLLMETSSLSNKNSRDETLHAFKLLEKCNRKSSPGFISESELRKAFTKWGEPLGKDELEKLVDAINKKRVQRNAAALSEVWV